MLASLPGRGPFFGVTLYNDYVYYTDWQARSLSVYNLDTRRRQTVVTGLMRPARFVLHHPRNVSGSPLTVDISSATMIASMIRGKIVGTVLCCVVYDNDMHVPHTYQQFVQLTVGLGLGFAFCIFFLYASCSCVICFHCVRFGFFSTKPRDWLGRTYPK